MVNGLTIWKSQGLTFKQAVIDLGNSEKAIGLTFVALSRLETFEGLYLKSALKWPRLQTINDKKMIKLRIKEEQNLRKLAAACQA